MPAGSRALTSRGRSERRRRVQNISQKNCVTIVEACQLYRYGASVSDLKFIIDMKRNIRNLIAVISATSAIGLFGCSKPETFEGDWLAGTPRDVTELFPSAKMATSLTGLALVQAPGATDGQITMTVEYDINGVQMDSLATADFTAYASVDGAWTYGVDDDDDMLISFELSSIDVDVRGKAPEVVKDEVTYAFMRQISHFSVISDVEIGKNRKTLTFVTHSPETKVHFRYVEPVDTRPDLIAAD